jgi:hypothetical protein
MVDANTASSRRNIKSRPKGFVKCHRDGCPQPGAVTVEAPCCGRSVRVCVSCAWEAFQLVDRAAARDCPGLAFGVLQ